MTYLILRSIAIFLIVIFVESSTGSGEKSATQLEKVLDLNDDNDNDFICRLQSGHYVPLNVFQLETCGKCYDYMPTWVFKPNSKLFYIGSGMFFDIRSNSTVSVNDTMMLSSTFLTNSMVEKWLRCCWDAIDCCRYHLKIPIRTFSSTSSRIADSNKQNIDTNFKNPHLDVSSTTLTSIDAPTSTPQSSCPRTWDGWTCWSNDVPIRTMVRQTCPDHIYWKITAPPCRGYVTKECTESGEWFLLNGREWSNYTNCARDDIYVRRLRYSIITNLISVSFIIPALVIFNCYRQLSNSPRIRLHKHLFACLLIYAILSSLLKLNLLIRHDAPEEESSGSRTSFTPNSNSTSNVDIYCLTLSLSLRYFRSSTYLCMFNEVFYLWQLIKKAFHAPSIVPLIVIAYMVPAIMTGSYIVVRLVNFDESEGFESGVEGKMLSGNEDRCWMLPDRHGWKEWIINGPNLAMLMINSILIIPIVREIYKKATSMPAPASYHHHHGGGSGSLPLTPHTPLMPISTPMSPTVPPQTNHNHYVNHINEKDEVIQDVDGHEGRNGLNTENGVNRKKSSILFMFSHTNHRLFHWSHSRQNSTSTITAAADHKTTSSNGQRSMSTMTVRSTSTFTKQSFLVSLRAATLLLPLYGLHYLVIVYRPDVDICWLSELYHYFSISLDGLQGSLVSILFCFGNNEVRSLLKRSILTRSTDRLRDDGRMP